MQIKLDSARHQRASVDLQKLFSTRFDEKLSDFRAAEIVDLMLKTMGPAIYNQAVQDVRAHLQGKLDDLDGEVFVDGDA
jgi:uncharacterized protein (DUF2164 family)